MECHLASSATTPPSFVCSIQLIHRCDHGEPQCKMDLRSNDGEVEKVQRVESQGRKVSLTTALYLLIGTKPGLRAGTHRDWRAITNEVAGVQVICEPYQCAFYIHAHECAAKQNCHQMINVIRSYLTGQHSWVISKREIGPDIRNQLQTNPRPCRPTSRCPRPSCAAGARVRAAAPWKPPAGSLAVHCSLKSLLDWP